VRVTYEGYIWLYIYEVYILGVQRTAIPCSGIVYIYFVSEKGERVWVAVWKKFLGTSMALDEMSSGITHGDGSFCMIWSHRNQKIQIRIHHVHSIRICLLISSIPSCPLFYVTSRGPRGSDEADSQTSHDTQGSSQEPAGRRPSDQQPHMFATASLLCRRRANDERASTPHEHDVPDPTWGLLLLPTFYAHGSTKDGARSSGDK
jgi:hypothetical protein